MCGHFCYKNKMNVNKIIINTFTLLQSKTDKPIGPKFYVSDPRVMNDQNLTTFDFHQILKIHDLICFYKNTANFLFAFLTMYFGVVLVSFALMIDRTNIHLH